LIHETAIISPEAQLGKNVKVGPWTYIGPNVEIGDDCDIRSHVVIKGPTRIGKGNTIYQFSSVGEDCQDKKYNGEPTRLEIGDNNIIRENVTTHRGTIQDNSLTKIGSNNLLMAYVHVAHDCIVGNNIILANATNLAGHVVVDDWAILGGFTGVHQFCKIGAHSFCGVGSVVVKDVPPFVLCAGQNAVPHGINAEGLKRRGYASEEIMAVRRAYKEIYRKGLGVQEALANLSDDSELVNIFKRFIEQSERGIIR
jgi:UDP-N-acetylglucosamine acyltransferase